LYTESRSDSLVTTTPAASPYIAYPSRPKAALNTPKYERD
jgi:hypothetical protein